MKKIAVIKKKEVLIGILALFLMLVGFMSYNPNQQNEYGKIADVGNYSERLGDATLVSSNSIENEINGEDTNENNNVVQSQIETETNETKDKTTETANQTDYFLQAKMDRNNTYSETIEIYEKMLESSNITSDQKAIAQSEITNITNEKKAIQTAENLIKMKGIADVVIFKNAAGVSVIVKSDVLLQEQAAQIQNIIEREFQIEGKNISITNK